MGYRVSVDTGGTFTDVVVTDIAGNIHVGKALTTFLRAYEGVENGLQQVAAELGLDVRKLLSQTTHFAYGTTRSTNAIVEGKTAKTAYLTTAGFPDTLLLREGGRLGGPFSPREFTPPYVPRYLTFEIDERIDSEGDVFRALDEASVLAAIDECRRQNVEAVGVSLIWSTVNPQHELRVGELLAEHLPGVAFTLSHQLNPVLREYRRGSSTVIDASLKPLMQQFLGDLDSDLRAAGFGGNLLISTSFGGSWPVRRMTEKPIYSVGSGPSMAPIAALHVGRTTLGSPEPSVLVCDTGGTTFDVGLISNGTIHYTGETWLGQRWTGHITGTKSVDVRSIGSGGGSIIIVDDHGLVRVGPESAGADPGPACYGRGGTSPTITDAAVILGYYDPVGFIGGELTLDVAAARAAMAPVADRLGTTVDEAARGAFLIAVQNIASAIREMTIAQGVDPRELTAVAGGGASGANIVQIARELGIQQVVLPATAGALSASGALYADIISDFSVSAFTSTRDFDIDTVNSALARAEAQADEFLTEIADLEPVRVRKTVTVDARYPGQVWELETPIEGLRVADAAAVGALRKAFHDLHQSVFQVNDPDQQVETLTWKLRVAATLRSPAEAQNVPDSAAANVGNHRRVQFAHVDVNSTPIYYGRDVRPGAEIVGPAVIQQKTTTLVVDPGAVVTVAANGDYLIHIGTDQTAELIAAEEEIFA
jgi:N-methylhydantoinase A